MPAMTMIRRTKWRERERVVFFHNKYYRWPDDLCTIHTHTQFKFHFFVAFFLLFLVVFFLFISFPKLLISLCELVRVWEILGDKTLANDHTAAATVEATAAAAVRSNRKLYMITAWFTANNKHNQMADRHYYFDFFFTHLSPSSLSSFFLAVSCLPLFHTYIIHTLFVCWYFLQHNSLALQFCCVDVCTIVRFDELEITRKGRKKERQKNKSKQNNKQTYNNIFKQKEAKTHTQPQKIYYYFFSFEKEKYFYFKTYSVYAFGWFRRINASTKQKKNWKNTNKHADTYNINAFGPRSTVAAKERQKKNKNDKFLPQFVWLVSH